MNEQPILPWLEALLEHRINWQKSSKEELKITAEIREEIIRIKNL